MGQYNTIPPNPFPPSSESAGGGGQAVLPIASTDTLGGVKVGSNLSIDESGSLSAPAPYVLPVASDGELGGVMIDGAGLEVDENGLLSVKTGDGLHTNVLGELCADSQGVVFSTDEQETDMTWIDGKKLFRRTFVVNAPGNNKVLVDNTEKYDVMIVENGYWLAVYGDETWYCPLNRVTENNISASFTVMHKSSTGHNLYIITYGQTNIINGKVIFTLLYTKYESEE